MRFDFKINILKIKLLPIDDVVFSISAMMNVSLTLKKSLDLYSSITFKNLFLLTLLHKP